MKKRVFYIVLFIGAALGLFFVFRGVGGNSESSASESSTEVKPIKTEAVNKEFKFPLSDGSEQVPDFAFEITNVELTDEIIVQGQKATAIAGRDFLIVNLKITNEYEKAIEMNTRDYIRLLVNGNEEEKLAPEIHNDPVEVQAISTKYTRVGFAIDENQDNLSLLVGQIKEDKEKLPIFSEQESNEQKKEE